MKVTWDLTSSHLIAVWVPGGDKALADGLAAQMAVGSIFCASCVEYEK
jgi:hypothetical protein